MFETHHRIYCNGDNIPSNLDDSQKKYHMNIYYYQVRVRKAEEMMSF